MSAFNTVCVVMLIYTMIIMSLPAIYGDNLSYSAFLCKRSQITVNRCLRYRTVFFRYHLINIISTRMTTEGLHCTICYLFLHCIPSFHDTLSLLIMIIISRILIILLLVKKKMQTESLPAFLIFIIS